jgi:HSP20 family protein
MSYLTPQSTWFRPTSNFDVNNGFFSALQGEIDHAFDEFGHFSSAKACRSAAPRMNVSETNNSVEIEIELPGVDEKDVQVALNDDVLTIKGEKRIVRDEAQTNYYQQERRFGRFARSITLPFEPDSKMVKTHFAKGVLKITLPMPVGVNSKTVKIPVKAIV